MYTFFDSQSGWVFTSPNTIEPPPITILPPPVSWDPNDLLHNLGKLRFMSAHYAHLPFTLRTRLQTGPLFTHLHYYNCVSIKPSEGAFIIFPSLVEKWVKLENFLTHVFKALPANCPPNVVLRPVPSDVGYTKSFKTEDDAHLAGNCALDAFQHLLTMCSWKMGLNVENPW
ncbi:hypothetical protein JVT61DRAFT_14397 [Boletus reticuloceps]|uniref:Uncharacterized protein n=1 Tax=Boletus reticuloceps TaxID=495285 RepID=A0A8I3ABR6_9AGAM|nr:hypothetical protein JVT61DRAFT_14397 [Boletus reticuloceps]